MHILLLLLSILVAVAMMSNVVLEMSNRLNTWGVSVFNDLSSMSVESVESWTMTGTLFPSGFQGDGGVSGL